MRHLGQRPLTHYFNGRARSVYADVYVSGAQRAKNTPRWGRHHRPRLLAWSGLSAFYRNRFYEIDRFYKARIDYPQDAHWPKLKIIDPDDFQESLEERLQKLALDKRKVYESPVNIGLRWDEAGSSATPDEAKAWTLTRHKLESRARHRTLDVDVEAANSCPRTRPHLLIKAAAHYAVFRDLFHKDAYFYPVIPLSVQYDSEVDGESYTTPVLYGNDIKPAEAQQRPRVSFTPREADKDCLWTLMAVNPDGDPFQEDSGVLHWLVCNIPASGNVAQGQEVVDYLPPLPFQGTGFHRLVFTLFRQDGKVEKPGEWALRDPDAFQSRSFHQPAWLKANEDKMTPAGLVFGQVDWDMSVKHNLHHRLRMEEPVYEYDWPRIAKPQQEEWPHNPQPAHRYLEEYIPEEVEEAELLRMRLELQSPFEGNVKRPKFPNLLYDRDQDRLMRLSFLQRRRERAGVAKFRALYENRIQ